MASSSLRATGLQCLSYVARCPCISLLVELPSLICLLPCPAVSYEKPPLCMARGELGTLYSSRAMGRRMVTESRVVFGPKGKGLGSNRVKGSDQLKEVP